MKCGRCQTIINSEDKKEWNNQFLCEDCYMDVLSPTRTCDPWAVHSAKSFEKESKTSLTVTEIQSKILKILEETGGIEPDKLCEKLNMKFSDLEGEVAALRHMEKLRAQLRDGKKVLCLW